MPRESIQTKKLRVQRLIIALHRTYPDAHCELDHASTLELLVATILSAQCTDKQVNLVTPALFAHFRSAADYADAPLEELENAIRRIGLFRSKAKNIRACCRKLVDHHHGEVPDTMEALTALHGVGRKTANVVLGNAFGKEEGIVVDTHVRRLSHRLELSGGKTPEKIEQDLQVLVPKGEWTQISHLLIWHGRRRCSARSPGCDLCEIRGDCPSVP